MSDAPKGFEASMDFILEELGAPTFTAANFHETPMQLWDAAEDRSCWRGPNNQPFPWVQHYIPASMGYGAY